ncbi:hypothetical protein SESBI_01578 [Sesbania bispinosa]|nr:hypothetical protein SESBI_01578 [Sesbania bispinosa]
MEESTSKVHAGKYEVEPVATKSIIQGGGEVPGNGDESNKVQVDLGSIQQSMDKVRLNNETVEPSTNEVTSESISPHIDQCPSTGSQLLIRVHSCMVNAWNRLGSDYAERLEATFEALTLLDRDIGSNKRQLNKLEKDLKEAECWPQTPENINKRQNEFLLLQEEIY